MERSERARKGGLARAARLAPERRSEIARMGWLALVERRFGGDRSAAVAWLTRKGQWASDPCPWNGRFPDPGPMPGGDPRDGPPPF